MTTVNQLRLSGASLERVSRPTSAGSSNDITHTNGMEEYPYVPDNAFAASPDKESAAHGVRAVPPPMHDDFYTTTGEAQQLGQADDDDDPFGGPSNGPNPFEAKSFEAPPPHALSGFTRPDAEAGRKKSTSEYGADGARQRRSLTNQLAGSSKIEVLATNPRDGSRPNSASTEERQTADNGIEALFLPNIKREQYIPVRVARDKIKQVLSDMAQMRTMHLAAIESMEKQHGILKAQLETACAAYCRKLTTDYNMKLTALEGEYKKRLTSVGHLAPDHVVAPLKARISDLEQRLAATSAELEETQTELSTARRAAASSAKSPTPSQTPNNANNQALEARVQELEQMLEMAQQQATSVGQAEEMEALREENLQLRQYCEQLEAERNGPRQTPPGEGAEQPPGQDEW